MREITNDGSGSGSGMGLAVRGPGPRLAHGTAGACLLSVPVVSLLYVAKFGFWAALS